MFRTLKMNPEYISFKKNTAYRFLNSSSYNWARLLLLLVTIIIESINKLTSNDRVSVLIVDDSLYDRSRSKKVELLSRVFDHTTRKFVKGFKMLTIGWSDGTTFLPVEDIKFSMALILVIELLKRTLHDNPVISEEIAHQIMDAFILALPTYRPVWWYLLPLDRDGQAKASPDREQPVMALLLKN